MGIEGMEEKSGESERKQMMKMKGGEMGVWDMKREGYVKEVKTKKEKMHEKKRQPKFLFTNQQNFYNQGGSTKPSIYN